MARHGKLRWIRELRKTTDEWLIKQPLPKVSPHMISGFSVLSSIVFVLVLKSPVAALIAGLLTLALDWLDGLVAKKYGWSSEDGYVVDVAADRLSEGIMLVPFLVPWYLLFSLNVFLSIFSFVKQRHVVLPLRQLFMVYFFFRFVV